MIIAILEDKKGFKKSIDIHAFLHKINIPIRPNITVEENVGIPTVERIEFRFQEWLKKGEVALYREK